MTYYRKTRFRPRKPVRTFRDLEVYQKSLEGAVAFSKKILPVIEEKGYQLKEEMTKCSLRIPRLIAEAHSARFDKEESGLKLLDQAMTDSNKMVVYLEQVRDIYSDKVERVLIEELIRKYVRNRRKIFHLYKAWEKFSQNREK